MLSSRIPLPGVVASLPMNAQQAASRQAPCVSSWAADGVSSKSSHINSLMLYFGSMISMLVPSSIAANVDVEGGRGKTIISHCMAVPLQLTLLDDCEQDIVVFPLLARSYYMQYYYFCFPGSGAKITMRTFALRSLLPADLSAYYTYDGSLTTPPCAEAVVWNIFRQTVKISESQVGLVGGIIHKNCPMGTNSL